MIATSIAVVAGHVNTRQILASTAALAHRHSMTPDPSSSPGFGIYVHWPFCASKCPYCDFNSHVRHNGWDEARFLAAYLAELHHAAALTPSQPVRSIFFGGGTPSLMQAATVAAILDKIAQLWPVETGAEITLEANPSSVEADKFKGFRTAGINRVSLGVQALDDPQLQALGRLHSAAEARAAIEIAARTFDRYSFDLIYARPGQTTADWRDELARGLALAGDHLSLYQLTIEPDTPFAALHAAGKLRIPNDEIAHDLYEITQELTEAQGLPAYEISNHARPGQESQHNLIYWRYGGYAGIGAGAHGRLVIDGTRHATANERHPERWLDRVTAQGYGWIERTPLSGAEEADEALLMGLRLHEGLDLLRIELLGGVRPSTKIVAALSDLGLIEPVGNHRLRATATGRFVLNELVRQLSGALENTH
jgi:putative oxygen-independent coproporphyrinogen III oxidase